jgi:hypothetical protein
VNLEAVRKELEQQDRERRQTEEQRRLQQQGSKIAELINEHFKGWRAKLRSTMAKAGMGKDLLPTKDGGAATEAGILFGDELLGIILGPNRHEGDGPIESGLTPNPLGSNVQLDNKSQDKVAKHGSGVAKKTASGGFNVAFEKIGPNEKRAKYDKDTRTIFVNLEHPRIAVELKGTTGHSPVDDPNFVRMAYEIAFTEYAIVIAQELSGVQYYYDPQDALVDVRQTLDDLSKAFASLWSMTGALR